MAESTIDVPRPPPVPVQVIDETPTRVRRPLDLVRVCVLAGAVALLAGLATVASATVAGANQDVTRLLNHVPRVFVHALSLVGIVGALVLPLALVIREVAHARVRRLVEALITGLIAIGVVGALDLAITADSSSALNRALTIAGTSTAVRPLDAYLAALFAFVVIVGLTGESIWRASFWVLTSVYVVSAFTAAQASLPSLVASPAIGALVAVLFRYAAGGPNVRPTAEHAVAELRRRGLDIVRMERVPAVSGEHRSYLATSAAGEPFRVMIFDRDLVASGRVYSVLRRLRLRAEVALPPPSSLERVAERRALLALGAEAAGARVPSFVAGVPCGTESIVLVYEQAETTTLDDATEAQIAEIWCNVVKLHRSRITHRGLTARSILVGRDGQIILPILTDGEAFASDLRIRLDRAQVLATTAQLVGAERAVKVARTMITDEDLAASLPLLQPIALPPATRAATTRDTGLLQSLRDQIQAQTDQQAPEPIRVERFRPRAVISLVALIVAAYILIGQLGSVNLASVFSAARWGWVPLVLVASAGTYFAAGLSLTGFVRERLSFARTVLAQVAASFAGFVTPPAVGGLAINIRYLRMAGLSATAAATSVGVEQVSNGILHVALLIVVAAATGTSAHTSLPIPGWAFIAVGVLVVIVLLALSAPAPRHWLRSRALAPLREAMPRLLDLLSSPIKLGEALGGALLMNLLYIAALWCAVHAFAGSVGVGAVAVVYLAGAAVASVAPTPGGLGAVEVALSTGLAAASMPSAAAISSVLLFRLATFWLPVPAGWLALHNLQRRGAL
jgi:uncharacterized membrane protein YbhN (UPF0104 family)